MHSKSVLVSRIVAAQTFFDLFEILLSTSFVHLLLEEGKHVCEAVWTSAEREPFSSNWLRVIRICTSQYSKTLELCHGTKIKFVG